jgi:DNA polymerase-3 subunit delta
MSVSLHLVCGVDDYLVEQQARKIVDAGVPVAERALGLEVLDGRVETKDAAQAVIRQCLEAVQTAGFFGGGKLVWLRNATFLNPQVRPGDNEEVKERVAELTARIKAGLPEGQRLLVTAVSIARNTAFFKACQAAGEVSDCGGGEKSWEQDKLARERLTGQLRERNLQMTEDVRERFLQRAGTSTRLLVNELEKLRLYLGNAAGQVAAEDVDAIVSVGREAMAWDLTDAMGERDAGRLMQALRRLQAQNENVIGLVAMAELRIRELIVLRYAIDQRWLEARETERGPFCKWKENLPDEADRLLGSLPRDPRNVVAFIQRKAAAQATRYTLNELRRARHALIELREKLVSSSTPPEILLELALLRLVAPRAGAARAEGARR